jgi:hypothetical protein
LIQSDKETQVEQETTLVSILLHTGTTLKGSVINHAMVISNVEKLTGLRFCSKCGLGFRTSDHDTEKFTKHCEECDGTVPKKLKLNSYLAFIPHIMKNKALQYMLAHKSDVKN